MSPIGHQSQAFKECILWVAATEVQVPDICTDSFQKGTVTWSKPKGECGSAPSLSLGKIAISPEVKVS